MEPQEKICKVLKYIKDQSEINADPTIMTFNFNTRLVGTGIVSGDEERRILHKLEKEGVIKFLYPKNSIIVPVLGPNDDPLTGFTSINIKLKPEFENYYSSQCKKIVNKLPSLVQRKQGIEKPRVKKIPLSMSNPIIWLIFTLIAAAIIYFFKYLLF